MHRTASCAAEAPNSPRSCRSALTAAVCTGAPQSSRSRRTSAGSRPAKRSMLFSAFACPALHAAQRAPRREWRLHGRKCAPADSSARTRWVGLLRHARQCMPRTASAAAQAALRRSPQSIPRRLARSAAPPAPAAEAAAAAAFCLCADSSSPVVAVLAVGRRALVMRRTTLIRAMRSLASASSSARSSWRKSRTT